MKIKAVKCMGCKSIIFSRTRHDFHFCPCGKTGIDGGQIDYVKVSFDEKVGYEDRELDLNVTLKELFDDWNKGTDKFGIIPG